MAPNLLANFIKGLDFSAVKPYGNYSNNENDPRAAWDQLEEFNEGITLPQLKEAFQAFRSKVCVENFTGRRTPGYDLADDIQRFLADTAEKFPHAEIAEEYLNTFVGLFTSGPRDAHTDLMERYLSTFMEECVAILSEPALGKLLLSLKSELKYFPDEDDGSYSAYCPTNARDHMKFFFEAIPWVLNAIGRTLTDNISSVELLINYEGTKRAPEYRSDTDDPGSKDKLKAVQSQYMELYNHYYRQQTTAHLRFAPNIRSIIRTMKNVMGKDFKQSVATEDNVQQQMEMIRAALVHEFHNKDEYIQHPVYDTLVLVLKNVIKGNMMEKLFDDFLTMILEFVKTKWAFKFGERIFAIFSTDMFYAMISAGTKTTKAMFDNCVKMIVTIVTEVHLTKPVKEMVIQATDLFFTNRKKADKAELETMLKLVKLYLETGRGIFILKAMTTLDEYKKLLRWKDYIADAKKILDIIGLIPCEKMHTGRVEKDNFYKPVHAYKDFMELFLEQLKKNKVLPSVQADLVQCTFRCLLSEIPHKAPIAQATTYSDYIDGTKLTESAATDILSQVLGALQDEDIEWSWGMQFSMRNILGQVLLSYDSDGKAVPEEHHTMFMDIFKICLEGEAIDDKLFPFYLDEHDTTIYFQIFDYTVGRYLGLHVNTQTMGKCAVIVPDIMKWTKLALADEHEQLTETCISTLQTIAPGMTLKIADSLIDVIDLFIEGTHLSELHGVVSALLKVKPITVCSRLQDLFDLLESLKEGQRYYVRSLLYEMSMYYPQEFNQDQIPQLFDMCKGMPEDKQLFIVQMLSNIAEKTPEHLEPWFTRLMDDKLFNKDSLNVRAGIIFNVAYHDEEMSHKAIDYLMKYATVSDPTIQPIVLGHLGRLAPSHVTYMQKYKEKFKTLEKSVNATSRDFVKALIDILEGKTYENYGETFEAYFKQQEFMMDELKQKVDFTATTVVSLGEHVVKQSAEIAGVKKDLDTMGERVDDVEEDLGETKIKVEEIDNKTMTNAPKWSRDLTKLMNPRSENDWRLLSKRLGYSNEDIRGWAQQHDPCMALLSEWYATRKTSEANHAILTALQEMNRLDGVAIMENAMKAIEGVVEDEEFEYPTPSPIFLSYQWGVQDEVKLLKQHLNMAGYECWMDIGQMGGGDKLFSKIDNGIRAAKVIICCTTEKYAQSPNCNREVGLSVNLGKPIIPLLMQKMDWPPKGAMGPIFSEYLFIRFFQRAGEETKDQRYWPVPKFQELLMQLNFFVVPDQTLVKKDYERWWAPIVEEVVIDKNKSKAKAAPQKTDTQVTKPSDESPVVFLSYQWGKQPQIKALYTRLTSMGYTVWMDIYQMGGGDSLYDKIDRGLRGCKTVVSCITPKYALSANCRREVSLADALKKPIVPLLLEQMKWPPEGPMGPVFTELLYINMHKTPEIQTEWQGDKFDELMTQILINVPAITGDDSDSKPKSKDAPKTSKPGKKPISISDGKPSASSNNVVAKTTAGVPSTAAGNTATGKPNGAASNKPTGKSNSAANKPNGNPNSAANKPTGKPNSATNNRPKSSNATANKQHEKPTTNSKTVEKPSSATPNNPAAKAPHGPSNTATNTKTTGKSSSATANKPTNNQKTASPGRGNEPARRPSNIKPPHNNTDTAAPAPSKSCVLL